MDTQRIARKAHRFSFLFKAAFIGGLILALLIPLMIIGSLISERESRRASVEAEIIHARGGEQTIAGPVIVVPYLSRSRDQEGRVVEAVEHAFFLPGALSVKGDLAAEQRHKGIYEAVVYTSRLSLEGWFTVPDFSGWRISPSDILWDSAVVSLELGDLRGMQEGADLSWGSRVIPFRPGRPATGLLPGGMEAPAAGLSRLAAGSRIPFALVLTLTGGGSLSFLPVADQTEVRLTSPWPSPSFTGSFLPAERTVSADGFTSLWKVSSMARSFPQRWRTGEAEPGLLTAASFGVALSPAVDTYQKVTRSVKYGVLFVFLPFLVFFLFEVLGGRRVHPLQYLLVGLAECLYYLLELSLAEHIPFAAAYAIAAAAAIAMVGLYATAVLGGWRRGILLVPPLAAAYGFLYATLQSEDWALLIGSAGLFLILAAVMYLTRRVDWYRAGTRGVKAPAERLPEPAGSGNP
jgi:inner membrane protein